MAISALERETRVLRTQGPDEGVKARLRAGAMPAHRLAGPMLCESMALWHDPRVRVVVSAASEDVLFALGLCDGLGVGRATLHYVVEPLFTHEPPRRGQRLWGLGDFRSERRLRRSLGR